MITDQGIRDISYGPSKIVYSYPGYIVNGYRYHIREYGQNMSTMNSDVRVKRSTYNKNEYDYYDVIEEILEI